VLAGLCPAEEVAAAITRVFTDTSADARMFRACFTEDSMTRHITRRHLLAAGAAASVAGLTARRAVAQDATPGASPATAVTYPVTVPHDGGETVIEQDPARIVALEWHLVEDLLVLGIQPVAIADVEGFKTWVTIETALGDEVQDVGTRQEPSLEAIAAAEPDLILGLDYRDGAIYDQLSDIAPTVLVSAYPTDDGETPLDDLRDRLRFEASFLDRHAEAEAAIAAMDATIEEQAQAVADAGFAGTPFAVVQGFTMENAPVYRIFTDGALVGDSISSLGLENVWTADGGEWGFTTNNVESFIELPEDVVVFYIVNDTDNILETFLADDPIWQSLPFVQDGRFLPLGGDTWTFGGTESVQRIVTRASEQLTGLAG
jgi:iron complex transport system substrate-binding protein